MICVQFDADKEKIIAVFGSPQDPDVYKNQGKVERDDERLIAYWLSIPEDCLPRN